jgi:hypothetical protein
MFRNVSIFLARLTVDQHHRLAAAFASSPEATAVIGLSADLSQSLSPQ